MERKHGRSGIGRKGYRAFQEVCLKQNNARLDSIYYPSEDIVAREIEGELIIVPLVSGIGNMEDELYTMNTTGKIIWDELDGKHSLSDIVRRLTPDYEITKKEMEKDVLGIISELLKRKLITEIKP